jgi:hypothetical protein
MADRQVEASVVLLDWKYRPAAPVAILARARPFWRFAEILDAVRWIRARNERNPSDQVRVVHAPESAREAMRQLASGEDIERRLADTRFMISKSFATLKPPQRGNPMRAGVAVIIMITPGLFLIMSGATAFAVRNCVLVAVIDPRGARRGLPTLANFREPAGHRAIIHPGET